ncbi:uncharacterized protein LOC112842745 [Oreochromis niloticus]|uniref:uncharacterized protein LOC112842745 n=1 Tax=Oreochromis niloticus TaxID=8128 RepID=UPI000DF25509|nr:uncharacterized protein LOC112842745 [Oreochromis niloticus]
MPRDSLSDTDRVRFCSFSSFVEIPTQISEIHIRMGNLHCPPADASQLASFARGICSFPSYNPSPHFSQMLSINSSFYLKNHYKAVQTSLTPEQLEDFTRSLRTTFGREGKVTLGGVGVVALSLAVLFDTLVKQVRGEPVAESGPISGLFLKDLSGYYPPQVYTISRYLRLVPHIANNPSRMREVTERCILQLKADLQAIKKLGEYHTLPLEEDVTLLNMHLSQFFETFLEIHLLRIKNGTAEDFPSGDVTIQGSPIFNLNCDPEVADKDFFGCN